MTRSSNPNRSCPDRVPIVSQEAVRAHASASCLSVPPSTRTDTIREPAASCPPIVSRPLPQPWFQPDQITWHYPNPQHPSITDFPHAQHTRSTTPCPLCGAPPRAACVTKTSRPISGTHKPRGQASR